MIVTSRTADRSCQATRRRRPGPQHSASERGDVAGHLDTVAVQVHEPVARQSVQRPPHRPTRRIVARPDHAGEVSRIDSSTRSATEPVQTRSSTTAVGPRMCVQHRSTYGPSMPIPRSRTAGAGWSTTSIKSGCGPMPTGSTLVRRREVVDRERCPPFASASPMDPKGDRTSTPRGIASVSRERRSLGRPSERSVPHADLPQKDSGPKRPTQRMRPRRDRPRRVRSCVPGGI